MSNRICKRCKSTNVVAYGYYGGTTYYSCKNCQDWGEKDEFPEATLFDRITASPEALGKEFVEPYTRWGEDGHLETLWRSNFRELSGMLFDTEEETIAATVDKLKEVCNE